MVCSRLAIRRGFHALTRRQISRGIPRRSLASSTSSSITDILASVKDGSLSLQDAETLLQKTTSSSTSTTSETLQSFANLDHTRSLRTGFPEVVFAETKTPRQVAMIMDDMARHVNETIQNTKDDKAFPDSASAAILATRVTPEMNEEISQMQLEHGTITYHEQARILSMTASSLSSNQILSQNNSTDNNNNNSQTLRVVVATAGTTDLPVAEEAAVVLEAAGVPVDRIFDVGVAGLHRVVRALPRLQSEDVGAVIVCAGMDGALPSVVGGLVDVPVFACPTSVGYGVSLGGVSAMLTMLNSCAPGVSVLNVDNGFGAAACAFKVVMQRKR